MKKTPWFPKDIKPVREGFYEIKTKYGINMAKWSNGWWMVPDSPIIFNFHVQRYAKWRGVFK